MPTTLTIEFTNTTCRCGCNAVLGSKKSRFAQGHDARFVSNMRQEALASDIGLQATVRLIDKSTDPATISTVTVKDAVETLGSTPLMEKLLSGFRKEQGRQADKAKRAEEKAAKAAETSQRREAGEAKKAKANKPKAKSPATQKAEAAKAADGGGAAGLTVASAPVIDLDTLGANDVAELDAIVGEPVATVEGEAPVARKNGGRTRRGNLNSQV